MMAPDICERVRLLQSSLRQVRRQTQSLGSGAMIHTFANRISMAQMALHLVDARCTAGRADDLGDFCLTPRNGAFGRINPSCSIGTSGCCANASTI